MKHITSITIGILLSAVVAQGAAAQFNIARYETERNRVYTTFGLDPALVTSIGYARVIAPFGHECQRIAMLLLGHRERFVKFAAQLGEPLRIGLTRSAHLVFAPTLALADHGMHALLRGSDLFIAS